MPHTYVQPLSAGISAGYCVGKCGYALGGSAEGGARGTLETVRIRGGEEMLWHLSDRCRFFNGCDRLKRRRQAHAWMSGRMVGEVLHGVARLVVMYRAVVIVMVMRGTDKMVNLVGDVVRRFRRARPALQREAMQRQEHHEKKANDTAHENGLLEKREVITAGCVLASLQSGRQGDKVFLDLPRMGRFRISTIMVGNNRTVCLQWAVY